MWNNSITIIIIKNFFAKYLITIYIFLKKSQEKFQVFSCLLLERIKENAVVILILSLC